MSDARIDAREPRASAPDSRSTPDFQLLDWDSRLFGFPVARVAPEAVDGGRLPQVVDALRSAGVRLAYATVPTVRTAACRALLAGGARHVDRKLRYRKAAGEFVTAIVGVESVLGHACTPDLESLALGSGAYSRFRVDPDVPEAIFATLYTTWIRRSLAGEIAADVLVVRDRGTADAMVTVGRPNESGTATIGLVAVAEGRRRSGLGRTLIRGVEAWGAARGVAAIDVVTQGRNTAACSLYAACGFAVVSDDAVFHLWLERAP